jgi:hypothetical protein
MLARINQNITQFALTISPKVPPFVECQLRLGQSRAGWIEPGWYKCHHIPAANIFLVQTRPFLMQELICHLRGFSSS